MSIETIKAKLRKIAALAERGVGGERENARRLLQRLLCQHNLTIEDLGKPKARGRYWFRCRDVLERQILFQCYFRATNKDEVSYYQRGREIGFTLSPMEQLELENLWRHFRPLWRREIRTQQERIVHAFVSKHDLYSASTETDSDNPLSPEERAALLSLMENMTSSDYVSVRRMLE